MARLQQQEADLRADLADLKLDLTDSNAKLEGKRAKKRHWKQQAQDAAKTLADTEKALAAHQRFGERSMQRMAAVQQHCMACGSGDNAARSAENVRELQALLEELQGRQEEVEEAVAVASHVRSAASMTACIWCTNTDEVHLEAWSVYPVSG